MKIKSLKNFFTVIFLLILTITFIEFFFAFFARNTIAYFSSYYFSENIQPFTKGFPEKYYEKHSERGFDLNKEFEGSEVIIPAEFQKPYSLFTNSIGCFDREHLFDDSLHNYIYLAGDSFTWAYVPFEKKFGSILENNLSDIKVLKCGIPHTGQKHQFSKFKEIFNAQDLSEKINIVILNIVANDVDNDFFYPHSTVINNYLVENKKWCVDNDKIKVIVKENNILNKKNINNYSKEILSFLLKYSATVNIAYFTGKKIAKIAIYNTDLIKINCPNESPNIYGYKNWKYDKNDHFAKPNIQAIIEWIEHSEENDYRLIFSIIPHKEKNIDHFIKLENILETKNVEYYNFQNEINEKHLTKSELYWNFDGHFNIFGNEVYAEYLLDIIN